MVPQIFQNFTCIEFLCLGSSISSHVINVFSFVIDITFSKITVRWVVNMVNGWFRPFSIPTYLGQRVICVPSFIEIPILIVAPVIVNTVGQTWLNRLLSSLWGSGESAAVTKLSDSKIDYVHLRQRRQVHHGGMHKNYQLSTFDVCTNLYQWCFLLYQIKCRK